MIVGDVWVHMNLWRMHEIRRAATARLSDILCFVDDQGLNQVSLLFTAICADANKGRAGTVAQMYLKAVSAVEKGTPMHLQICDHKRTHSS